MNEPASSPSGQLPDRPDAPERPREKDSKVLSAEVAVTDQAIGGENETVEESQSVLPPPPRPLKSDIAKAASRLLLPTVLPGPTIGDLQPRVAGYEILDRLGRGGMSMVYLARQTSLGRPVALKLLTLPGPPEPKDQARFRAEAEAAARLQHPRIVQIFEVGTHEGVPYLALEYVDGGSLARRLDDGPLPFRDTALLVEEVARAVGFAHERGVIHRDIKPANILLTADGTPKLTDFGLAKHLDAEQSPTQTGDILGTPGYMSPEQANGRIAGPPADLYGLGATLYQMLTGRPPFRGETPLQTLRQAQENDPLPPSRVQPEVPRDLEVICLKCLEKEPNRRYPDALALAEDLRRFLAGEPIRARPVRSSERAVKWVRRHPPIAALIVVVAAAIVALSGGAVIHYKALRAALFRERDLAGRAENQRRVAEGHRAAAEANLGLFHDAVERYYTRVSENRLLDEPGMEPLRKELLESAREFYSSEVKRPGATPEAEAALARAYRRLAQVTHLIDSVPKALETLAQALDIQERLARDQPGWRDVRGELAASLQLQGILERELGHLELAEAELRRALSIDEALSGEDRADTRPVHEMVVVLTNLGQVYQALRDSNRQEHVCQRALEISERLDRDHPGVAEHQRSLAVAHNNLGVLYRSLGRLDPADDHLRRSLEIRQRLAADHPKATNLRRDLAIGYHNLGNIRRAAGRLEDAASAYREALSLRDRLADERPDIAKFQIDLATTLNNLGILYHLTNHAAQGEAVLTRALAVNESLTHRHPEIPAYRASWANTFHNLGILYQSIDRLDRAREAYQHALELDEGLVTSHSRVPAYAIDLVENLAGLGNVDLLDDRAQAALDWYQRALSSLDRMPRPGRDQPRAKTLSMLVHRGRALALTRLDRFDEAMRSWAEALRLAAAQKRGQDRQDTPLSLQLGRAITRARLGDYARATAEVDSLTQTSSLSPHDWYDAARAYACGMASSLKDQSELADARRRLAGRFATRAAHCLGKALKSDTFRRSPLLNRLWAAPELDCLRTRTDFRLLTLDIGFPSDPFAR